MSDLLKPVGDRLLLKVAMESDKTEGGIHLPEMSLKQTHVLEVVAVGEGNYSDEGELVPVTAKVGDRVVLPRNTGTEVILGGEKHILVSEQLCHAIVGEA